MKAFFKSYKGFKTILSLIALIIGLCVFKWQLGVSITLIFTLLALWLDNIVSFFTKKAK